MNVEPKKSKGMVDAEAQLMALAAQGVKSEMDLKATPVSKREIHEVPTDDETIGPAGIGVLRRFRLVPEERPEDIEEPLDRKISPSVRASTWMEVRKLLLRLEEKGEVTTLNKMVDSALSTMAREMNAGLDGKVRPDAYDIAVEAMKLLRALRKTKVLPVEHEDLFAALEDRFDAL